MLRHRFVGCLVTLIACWFGRTGLLAQENAASSPYGQIVGPTQAEIQAANERFRRIRQDLGLEPMDEPVSESDAPAGSKSGNDATTSSVDQRGRLDSGRNRSGRQSPLSLSTDLSPKASRPALPKPAPLSVGKNGRIEIAKTATSSSTSGSGNPPSAPTPKYSLASVTRELAESSSLKFERKSSKSIEIDLNRIEGCTIAEAMDRLRGEIYEHGLTLFEVDGSVSILDIAAIDSSQLPLRLPTELHELPPNLLVRTRVVLKRLLPMPLIEDLEEIALIRGRVICIAGESNLGVDGFELELIDRVRSMQETLQWIDRAEQLALAASVEETVTVTPFASERLIPQLNRFLELHRFPDALASLPAWEAATTRVFATRFEPVQSSEIRLVGLPIQLEEIRKFVDFVHRSGSKAIFPLEDGMYERQYPIGDLRREEVASMMAELAMLGSDQDLDSIQSKKSVALRGTWREHNDFEKLLSYIQGPTRQLEIIDFEATEASGYFHLIRSLFPKELDPSTKAAGDVVGTISDRNALRIRIEEPKHRILLWCNRLERKEIAELLGRYRQSREIDWRWTRYWDGRMNGGTIDLASSLENEVADVVTLRYLDGGRIELKSPEPTALDAASLALENLHFQTGRSRAYPVRFRAAGWLRLNLQLFDSLPSHSVAAVRFPGFEELFRGSPTTGIRIVTDTANDQLVVENATDEQLELVEWLIACNDISSP